MNDLCSKGQGKYCYLITFCLLIILSSCGGSDPEPPTDPDPDPTTNLNINYSAPLALTANPIPNLQAKVSIKNTDYNINVNTDNSITDTISNIPAGEVTIDVEYFVTISSHQIIVLQASQDIDIANGVTTTITLAGANINRNFDSDTDGYTNLAEIRIGTDALNYSDTPQGENPAFSFANNISSKTTSVNFKINSQIAGPLGSRSTSTNFIMQHGFSQTQ